MITQPKPTRSIRQALLDLGLRQGVGWAYRAVGLPLAGVAAVVLALAWSGLSPHASDWMAKLVPTKDVEARAVAQRLVCDPPGADALLQYQVDTLSKPPHAISARPVCPMREETILRYTDAGGTQHDVVAKDGYDRNALDGGNPKAFDPYRERIPLLEWNVAFEGGSDETLGKVLAYEPPEPPSDVQTGPILPTRARPPTVPQFMLEQSAHAIEFTAWSWLRPLPDTPVLLRYTTSDPERAWLVDMIDRDPPNRMPLLMVPIAAGFGAFLAFIALSMLFMIERRALAIVAAGLMMLSTPLWAPRLFDVMTWFSARSETIAGLQRTFPELAGDSSRRTEPERIPAPRAERPPEILAETYESTVAGLIPPRPDTAPRDYASAFETICSAVSERLAALPPAQQGARFQGALALFQQQAYTPADCTIAAAVRVVQDAQSRQEPPPPEVSELLRVIELADFEKHVHLRDPAAKERLVGEARLAAQAAMQALLQP